MEAVVPGSKNLAKFMYDVYCDTGCNVSCITKYNDAKRILGHLMNISNNKLRLNEVSLFADYEDEYLIVIDDFGISVYCTKIFDDYMSYSADYLFISNKCNPDVLTGLEDDPDIVFYSYEMDNHKGVLIDSPQAKTLYSFYSADENLIAEISEQIDEFIKNMRKKD